jgi:hypothetical protein
MKIGNCMNKKTIDDLLENIFSAYGVTSLLLNGMTTTEIEELKGAAKKKTKQKLLSVLLSLENLQEEDTSIFNTEWEKGRNKLRKEVISELSLLLK